MVIDIGSYQVHFSRKTDSHIGKGNQKHYATNNEYEFGTHIGISIYQEGVLISNALISGNAGGTGIHEQSQIVTQESIVLCCSDSIFNLSLPHLRLNWKVQADTATCFGIYPLGQDFIIHGELEISRISKGGDPIWKVSGSDIFTTLKSEKDDFHITDNYIFATDWKHQKYQIDFDGNVINC